MIPAAVCSIYIGFCTKRTKVPERILFVFALVAFVMSISWVSFLSNFVVDLLAMLGLMLSLPKPLLGLTLLAWGNCMGDMNANVAMTKKGFGEMALTGCMAGPVFNVFCGLGASCVLMLINDPDRKPIDFDLIHDDGELNTSAILPFGLIVAEIPALVVIFCNAFMNEYHIAKPFALLNVILYILVITALMSYTIYDAFFKS